MTRRPDGYVYENLDEYRAGKIVLYPDSMGSESFKPVCLVSPELLDWVDKAKKCLEKWVQSDTKGGPQLLAELEKILPEEE